MDTLHAEGGDFTVDWEQKLHQQWTFVRILIYREKPKSLDSALTFLQVLAVNLEFLDLGPFWFCFFPSFPLKGSIARDHIAYKFS